MLLRHGMSPLLLKRSWMHSTRGLWEDTCTCLATCHKCWSTEIDKSEAAHLAPVWQTDCPVRLNHTRTLLSVISGLPSHWKWPSGHSRETWTCTIQRDQSPVSVGVYTAWKRVQNCEQWRQTVLQHGSCCCWWYFIGWIPFMMWCLANSVKALKARQREYVVKSVSE